MISDQRAPILVSQIEWRLSGDAQSKILGGWTIQDRRGLRRRVMEGRPVQFAWKVGELRPRPFGNLISTYVIARGKVRGGPSLKVEGARCPWTPPDPPPSRCPSAHAGGTSYDCPGVSARSNLALTGPFCLDTCQDLAL